MQTRVRRQSGKDWEQEHCLNTQTEEEAVFAAALCGLCFALSICLSVWIYLLFRLILMTNTPEYNFFDSQVSILGFELGFYLYSKIIIIIKI